MPIGIEYSNLARAVVKLCGNEKSSGIACGDGLRVQEGGSYNEKGVTAPNTTGVAMVRTDFIFSTELGFPSYKRNMNLLFVRTSGCTFLPLNPLSISGKCNITVDSGSRSVIVTQRYF